MLKGLHIENIAVIERADISFTPGFNVLTGETGAGKSIVIDAIGAALGERTSRELVRAGAEKALVSAVFTPDNTAAWCEENEVEPEDELIIQRRITPDGKSSCRVNGVPVSAQQLRALGACLLDIHGQNDGLRLLDEQRHLSYLDAFGTPEQARKDFQTRYAAWREVKKKLEAVAADEQDKERLTQTLHDEIQELEKAQIEPGQEAELEQRRDRMKNSGRLCEALDGAYNALYEGDVNAIALSTEAQNLVSHAAQYEGELSETAQILKDARFQLEDAAERISDLRRTLEFSPREFDEIESRLSLLRRLEKRYGCTEEELALRLETNRERLSQIEYAADMLVRLEKERAGAAAACVQAAKVLTAARRQAAERLEQSLVAELRYLSMPSVRFQVELTPVDAPEGFEATGADRVRFLMSANAGETPGRIAKIASGGELSRIMLAMKGVFSQGDPVPSLVFDEIDTGVSGVAAQRVGEKIGLLSRSKQILCITHLPQIAAMADTHFAIAKAERDGRTYTTVTPLDRAGRLQELARLHGGDVITETTLKSAAEQLDAARRFRAEA